MTAVAKLPKKWREEAADHDRHKDPLPASILRECADELIAALSPAELGGVELPVGEVSDGFSGSQRAVHLYGPIRCQPAPGTKLYTTPRAASASAGEGVSPLTLAVIGRKHFGNPIPQEWYAAARELLNAAPQLAQAQKDESPTITSGGIVEVNPAKAVRYAYQQGNVKKTAPQPATGMTDCRVPHSKYDPCHNCEPDDTPQPAAPQPQEAPHWGNLPDGFDDPELNTPPAHGDGEVELATALRKWQAVLRSDAECSGLNNGYRNACEHHAAHIDTLLAQGEG